MRNKNRKDAKESGKMLALTALSMNLLLLAIILTAIWGVHLLLSDMNQINNLAGGFRLVQ
jgi:hypothetical protein